MQKCTKESLAKEMLLRKQFITKRLTKEKSHTEELQVETFNKEKICDETVVYSKLLLGKKSSSSKSSPTSNKMASKPLKFAYTIFLGRTKSAIAFKVLIDGINVRRQFCFQPRYQDDSVSVTIQPSLLLKLWLKSNWPFKRKDLENWSESETALALMCGPLREIPLSTN